MHKLGLVDYRNQCFACKRTDHTVLSECNHIMMKFHLQVALLVVVTLSVKISTLNLCSDEEQMTQCTAHASGYVETMVEAGETNFNSKGMV